MKRVVVSTSSSSLQYLNIPHNIRFVPFHIIIDEQDYLDIRDIDTARLAQMIYQNPKLKVQTSPATEQEVFALFEQLHQEGYTEVFFCTISSAISDSHQIFDRLKAKYVGHMNIYIYDTKTLNINEGVLAFEADLMIQEGKPMLEIIKRLDALRQHSLYMLTLSELDFLIKKKRIPATTGFIANLFDIKPIMWVNDDGMVVPRDKIRKIEKSLYYMAEEAIAYATDKNSFIYITDTATGLFIEELKELLANEYGLHDVPVIPVSTVSLANHGIAGIGLGVHYGEVPRIAKYF